VCKACVMQMQFVCCHVLQWKEAPANQLMDSKLKCVFELPTGDEPPLQVTRN